MTDADTFEDLLTPEALSALMRSTWTWDDRAVRRDFAALLVDLDAARAARALGDIPDHAEALRARALAAAADFVANVAGPQLIADTGNPLGQRFVAPVLNRAQLTRLASTALARVQEQAGRHASRAADVEYAPESSWLSLLSTEGIGKAMRAYGFGLSSTGFFGNAGLAWQTLRAVGSDSGAQYVKDIERGNISATLAVAEQSGSWDPALVSTKAVHGADNWQLSGEKHFVPAADGASVYLVMARSIAGPSLYAVERTAPGLQITRQDVVDETRPLFRLHLADAPAELVGVEGAGGRLMMTALDLATTALAGEQVGLIEKSMSLLAGPNTPPAPQAEAALHHAAATSLWRRAVDAQTEGSTDAAAAAASAHIGCSRAARQAATIAADVLGPSSETDAVYRRALSADLLFGGPALSHERLLERLGV